MLPVTKRMDKSKRKGNYIVTRILVGLILSILMRKKKTHQLTATEILNYYLYAHSSSFRNNHT